MSFKKRLIIAVLCIAALIGGCGAEKQQEVEEIPVPYSAQQMALVALSAFREAEQVYTDTIWRVAAGEGGETYEKRYLQRLKTFFIEMTAMDRMAEQREVKLSDGEKKRLEDAADRFYEDSVRQEPKLNGLDQEGTRALFLSYGLALKCKREIMAARDVEVSQSEAKVIRIQQIAVDNTEDAEQIHLRAMEGADFYLLAKTYAKGRPVDLKVGRGELPEEVEAAVFNLEDGAVSDVIESDGHLYIVKIVDSFDEAATEIRRQSMQAERAKKRIGEALRRFLLEKRIEMDGGDWKRVEQLIGRGYQGEDFFEAAGRAMGDEGIQGGGS